jgi:hypothetical protein
MMRPGYRELDLELVSLGDDHSFQPKQPPMAEEKRDDGARDPFKILLKKSLARQRNEMMDNFTQILRRHVRHLQQATILVVQHPSRYKLTLICPYLKAR